MAAAFTYNAIQNIGPNQGAALNSMLMFRDPRIFHLNESPVVYIRGPLACCGCNDTCLKYVVTANGNIAIPTGGTVEEISVAIASDGVPIQTSIARYTPAAVEEYSHFTSIGFVVVPAGYNFAIALLNTSTQNIEMQNLTVTIAGVI